MKKRDLTTGSVTGNLTAMALPTMFGFFAQTFYDIVDMMWIGMISPQAVAGVTIYGSIFAVIFLFNDIIGTSSISLISQAYGEGDKSKTRKVIENAISFKALIAVIAAICLSMSLKPLIGVFTDDAVVYKAALDYGYIRVFFLPVMFSSYTINTAMRCIGDSKKPFYLMLLVSVLNVLLDPIFIFETIPGTSISGFGLGVFGAALATVISITISAIVGMWILLKGRTYIKINFNGLFKLDKKLAKKFITIGMPNGFEGLSRNLGNLIILKMVTSYGTIFVAAYGIVAKLTSMCWMPLIGFSMGSGTIVGQNLAINNIKRAHKTAIAAASMGAGFMLVLTVLFYISPESIMSIFTDSKEVLEIGTDIIHIMMPGMIALGVMFGLGSVFSGSGYNIPYLVSTILTKWVFMIPLGLLTTYVFKLSYIWLIVLLMSAEILEMIVISYFYTKGKWKSTRVN